MHAASKMRIPNPTSDITLPSVDKISFSRFVVRVFGDPVLGVCDQSGVGIALSKRTERAC